MRTKIETNFLYSSGVLPSPVTYFDGVQYDNKTNAGRSHEARFGYIPSSLSGSPSGMGVSSNIVVILWNMKYYYNIPYYYVQFFYCNLSLPHVTRCTYQT